MPKIFRGNDVPQGADLAGYAWLIDKYGLRVPTPRALFAIAGSHRPTVRNGWTILTKQYAPAEELGAHLAFALKWEGLDLAVLSALFTVIDGSEIAAVIKDKPTGAQSRRLWFIYEWLTGLDLPLDALGKVTAVDVVDPKLQFGLNKGEMSARHRVRNNLPGTVAFCPMVRRTSLLDTLSRGDLPARVRNVIGAISGDVLGRAAAFFLLSDSRASYRIEGETPSGDKMTRWAHRVKRAGTTPLSVELFESLQRAVLGDVRFQHLGLRETGGFVGEHDRATRAPVPEHISARAEDVRSLMDGIVAYDERAGRGAMDGVVAAAVEAFGFVYIHPFEDGNGRIHRWLLHHVLAGSGFAPAGMVFPVSAVMLREINAYRETLRSYSRRLLPCIEWLATESGNVDVLNETRPWYRYFDATQHAEFLYRCVEATVEHDLPYELAYLEAYDQFTHAVNDRIDMPAGTLDLLHSFLRQNSGQLSSRARTKEFALLTNDEVRWIEEQYLTSTTTLPEAPRQSPTAFAPNTGLQ